jgi:hypothetical protein
MRARPSDRRRAASIGGLLSLALLLIACASEPPRAPSAPAATRESFKREVLAATTARCNVEAVKARLAPPPGAPEPPPPPVGDTLPFKPFFFLQMAVFTLPSVEWAAARGDLSVIVDRPSVELLGAPQLAVELGSPVRASLWERIGPLSEPSLRELGAASSRASDGNVVLELDVTLQLPHRLAAGAPVNPPEARVRLAAALVEQRASTLAREIAELPGKTLVVVLTPYAMNEASDQRALFECQLEQRRALSAAR